MKLDVLVFAAHPDDAELSCSGTILSLIASGKKVGIVDLTRGEMATRGTPEIRAEEAADASSILNLTIRENLRFKDVFFKDDDDHVLEIVKKIRQYQPTIVLANAVADRHPDHSKAAQIAKKAIFLSGLNKIETKLDATVQNVWRVKNLYHYIQTEYLEPDFIVDVSDFWDKRMATVRAFKSQFFDPDGEATNTLISSPEFMASLEARGKEFGMAIRVSYGEGFISDKKLGVSDLTSLR